MNTTQPGADNALDLDKLEALARELRGLRWNDPTEGYGDGGGLYREVSTEEGDVVFGEHSAPDRAEAAFIAAANPAAVLALIALARRAPAEQTAETDEFMVYGRAGNRRVDLEAVLRDALASSAAQPVETAVGGALMASAEPFMWIDPEQAKWTRLTDYANTIEVTGHSVKFGHATMPLYAAPTGSAAASAELLNEVADVLSENNWRGDLVERLRELATSQTIPTGEKE